MGRKLITFAELAEDIGVSKQTLWRKLRPHRDLFSNNGERKRYYDRKEQALAKKLIR